MLSINELAVAETGSYSLLIWLRYNAIFLIVRLAKHLANGYRLTDLKLYQVRIQCFIHLFVSVIYYLAKLIFAMSRRASTRIVFFSASVYTRHII